MAVLAPANGSLGYPVPGQLPDFSPWPSTYDSFESQLSYEDHRQQRVGKMDPLIKLGGHQAANSRLGNLQYSSNGHSLALPHPSHAPSTHGSLPDPCFAAADFCSPQHWDDRTSSPYRGSLIGSYRAQDFRDGSASSSPFGSFSGSPRSTDFRAKRQSCSTNGVSSPRTPSSGVGGHRIGIDPRLVVGSPLEIAWEVLQSNPRLAPLLNLQPSTAKLQNLPVQEDDEVEAPCDAAAAAREPDAPLNPEQLTHEQGLVRSCRGLPARVRDDLIKAARLAVTRHDSNGRELPGTGLLPFFWRVQSNLKWLLQQPATLKGQLLPGQIDFITEEQRGLSFQKTVQQRMRLGELAVMLHCMLQEPEDAPGTAAACAAAAASRSA